MFVWGYSFELPLFFLLSGYLTSAGNRQISFGQYAAKQFQSVLIPYFEFSMAYIALYTFLRVIRRKDVVMPFLKDCAYTVSGVGLGAIWFLPTFFLASLMAFIIIRRYVNGGGGTSVSPCVC